MRWRMLEQLDSDVEVSICCTSFRTLIIANHNHFSACPLPIRCVS